MRDEGARAAGDRRQFVLDEWATTERGKTYEQLSAEQKAGLRGRLEEMYRRNTYDPATHTIVLDPVRARARQPAPASGVSAALTAFSRAAPRCRRAGNRASR